MREIESSRAPPPLLGPGVADLASAQCAGAWAEEFLATEAQMRVSSSELEVRVSSAVLEVHC